MCAAAEERQVEPIRPARRDEIEAVRRICIDSFPRPYSVYTLQHLQRRAREGFMVAEVDGVVAGFIIALPPVVPFFGRMGEIVLVAVDPRYRKMGLGRRLMEAGMGFFAARGLRRARLHVETNNQVAIGLYERLGFNTVARIPNYYQNGSDALEMVARLAPEPFAS